VVVDGLSVHLDLPSVPTRRSSDLCPRCSRASMQTASRVPPRLPPPERDGSARESGPEELLALAEVGRELTSGSGTRSALERALEVTHRRLGASGSVLYVTD